MPTQVGPDTRTTRTWAEQAADEEEEAAQHAVATSSAAAPAEDWTNFQDLTMDDPSPAFLPEPPVYNDVRQGPTGSANAISTRGIYEEEPPSTEHLPDAATPAAMTWAPAKEAEAIVHAFEPRGMSSFDNPFLDALDRPEAYGLA